MHDLGLPGLILLGLWIWEGWVRVPRGAWLFRRGRSTWRAEGAGRLPGSGSWGWMWLPPGFLAPRTLMAQSALLSPSGDRLWLHASQAPLPGGRLQGEGAVLAWDGLAGLRAGIHQMRHQDQAVGAVADPALVSRSVAEARALAEDHRPPALEAWASRQLDPGRARRRLLRLRLRTRDLRLGLLFYTCWLLVLAPLIVYRRGWVEGWPWLLGGTLMCQMLLGGLAARAHARLLPARAEERLGWALACFLSPPALLRSFDQLALRATADLHPVALGCAILTGDALQTLLLQVGRDLRHPCQPLAPEPDAEIETADREHRERMERLLAQRARAADLRLDLEAPPAQLAIQGGEAWCPRCHAIYARREGACLDCGIGLIPNCIQ